jgi:hypothetical protein
MPDGGEVDSGVLETDAQTDATQEAGAIDAMAVDSTMPDTAPACFPLGDRGHCTPGMSAGGCCETGTEIYCQVEPVSGPSAMPTCCIPHFRPCTGSGFTWNCCGDNTNSQGVCDNGTCKTYCDLFPNHQGCQ